jgi:predicted lipoprotein with Yx(FWY)xxD motif
MESGIRSVRTRSTLAAAGVLALLALTACGSTYDAAPPKNAANTAAAPAAASPTATETTAPSPEPTASGDAGSATDDVGQTPTTLKATTIPKMGSVVVDEKGWVLYRYDKDTAEPASKSACNGDCAKVWPPVIADDQKLVGLDKSLIGEVTRADGAHQVTLAGWPLYYYIGDKRPGTWRGQNVGGVWWVIDPQGKKNKTCVPTNPSPAPKAPSSEPKSDATPSSTKSKADSSGYSY